MIVVPFCSLTLAAIFAHTVLGPIGWKLGSIVSAVVYAGLTSGYGWLFAAVFGFLYAPLVITGLHHMTNAIDLQLISEFNGTMLWPMIALSNIAQGSAVLAMIVMQRKNERAQQINIPSCISCYLGVTEPAIFGVNLKYGFPFVCGMIGSSIAGVISVSAGVMANSIGVGGLPGILSIKPQFMLMFAVAMLAAIIIPFVLTIIVGKKKLMTEDYVGEAVAAGTDKAFAMTVDSNEVFASPMEGKLIPLEEVEDKTFSSKAMGDGFAIIPDGKNIVAPMSGELTLVFPTGHAYGIRTASGTEILIHVGMDTVELNGEGFHSYVQQGQQVHQGDLLCRIDPALIQSKGKSLVSPVIFTSGEKITLRVPETEVKSMQENIIEIEKEN